MNRKTVRTIAGKLQSAPAILSIKQQSLSELPDQTILQEFMSSGMQNSSLKT